MCVARFVLIVLAAVAFFPPPGSRGADPKSPDEYGLAVGQKMPFHVADFVNGKVKHRCGCPGVMIANAKARGVIIWSRGASDPAFRLAKALDAGVADGDKLALFLVAFDADAKVLAERAVGLGRVVVGKSCDSAQEEWERRGVDPKASVLVFFLDTEDIKATWSFAAGELSDAKVKEFVMAAKTFATGDK